MMRSRFWIHWWLLLFLISGIILLLYSVYFVFYQSLALNMATRIIALHVRDVLLCTSLHVSLMWCKLPSMSHWGIVYFERDSLRCFVLRCMSHWGAVYFAVSHSAAVYFAACGLHTTDFRWTRKCSLFYFVGTECECSYIMSCPFLYQVYEWEKNSHGRGRECRAKKKWSPGDGKASFLFRWHSIRTWSETEVHCNILKAEHDMRGV